MSADTPEKQWRLWYYRKKYEYLSSIKGVCSANGAAAIQAEMDTIAEAYNDLAGINQNDRRQPPPPTPPNLPPDW